MGDAQQVVVEVRVGGERPVAVLVAVAEHDGAKRGVHGPAEPVRAFEAQVRPFPRGGSARDERTVDSGRSSEVGWMMSAPLTVLNGSRPSK